MFRTQPSLLLWDNREKYVIFYVIRLSISNFLSMLSHIELGCTVWIGLNCQSTRYTTRPEIGLCGGDGVAKYSIAQFHMTYYGIPFSHTNCSHLVWNIQNCLKTPGLSGFYNFISYLWNRMRLKWENAVTCVIYAAQVWWRSSMIKFACILSCHKAGSVLSVEWKQPVYSKMNQSWSMYDVSLIGFSFLYLV